MPRTTTLLIPCGCYHLFFPTERIVARPPADSLDEGMFSPQTVRAPKRDEVVVLRIESGTHYLHRVSVEPRAQPSTRYQLDDDRRPTTLPRASGGTRSAYGSDGLMPGTERGERYFLWPMGVESAGPMRQWGHHATAFVGRRHFDDPNLLASYFSLSPAGIRCQGSMKLRVATYNIHKGVMGLRQKVRIHGVRLALSAIDADIVFLQEVRGPQRAHGQAQGLPGRHPAGLPVHRELPAPRLRHERRVSARTPRQRDRVSPQDRRVPEPRHLRPRAGEAGTAARRVAHRRAQRTARAALAAEVEIQAICMQDPNFREAYDAFVARRKPVFR